MGNALDDHLIAITADRLRPGMFVAALDRLWLHTPFPPGGFYVRDQQKIDQIGRYCTLVYIDPQKSKERTCFCNIKWNSKFKRGNNCCNGFGFFTPSTNYSKND